MKGRPSVRMEIEGIQEECLLDTGARINVMSQRIVKRLKRVKIMDSSDILKCANDSQLKTKGRADIEVKIGDQKNKVPFIIVEHITPDVIGGIVLQKQFGIELQWCEKEAKRQVPTHVCNIEAKYGRKIDRDERYRRAITVLKLEGNERLKEIVKRHQNAFMADKWDIGCTSWLKHQIKTKSKPINEKPRRQPINLENKIEEAVKNLLENGIIRKCSSPWNTPLICVWKKEKDEIRLCMDFRQLNLVTERQAFPMPNITEMMDRLNGSRFFTSIDLGNAYYQIELDEESKIKTAFSTKEGQFCFNRMPFGIAAAPGTFQELMNTVLKEIPESAAYLDDILIFTKTLEDHYATLDRVLGRIEKAGLRVNPEKCHILKKEVKYLGHIINQEGIQTDPSKITAIKEFEKPKCVKNLRSFLGICNYYRRFIKGYADKSRLLEEMCGKTEKKIIWTETNEKVFNEMKEALMSPPILGFPDFRKEFTLDTDASFNTIGAVLSQADENGFEKVIAYGSHAMNNHEKGYCITRKELLAIYFFCQHFNHYLYGKRFKLRTDHKAITFMTKTKKPITAQFQTWINYLSSLDIQMEYRKGSLHTNADMLSRSTCGTCAQCLMEHEEPKTGKLKTRKINAIDTTETNYWQKDNEEIRKIMEEIDQNRAWKFRVVNNVVETKEGKIWIPESRKREKIISTHELLSHAGAEKVMKYLEDKYDMKDMKETIKKTISQCDACQRVKTITTQTKEEVVKLSATEPFEKIYIDICGPLKETFRRKRYIMAIIDQYSRYISLTALARQDEESIISTIMNKWILRHGAPKEIHTDCGKSFESRSIEELAKSMDIKICYSSPYHHNTNGIVERQFRTIRDFINTSLKDNRNKKDWADILPEIEFTLNASFQKTIGKSPAEIIFGRKIYREKWYGEKLNHREEENTEIQTKREFRIGDYVLFKAETRAKDKDRCMGPYKVIRKIHDRRYLLENEEGKVVERNVEKLRKYSRNEEQTPLKEGDVGNGKSIINNY